MKRLKINRHVGHHPGFEPNRWAALAQYNGEKSRGLVHTPEWDALMAIEQAKFDAEHVGWRTPWAEECEEFGCHEQEQDT